ncbi:MAG: amino acid ABC transporter substrate-binding protein [Lautropia sp.]|nr:MAG: amino acid ABC transporter substrate-binding protein [Lautropia sp.]
MVARIACRRGGCSNPGFSGFKTGLIMNLMRSVLAGVCVALAASGVQARSWADIEKSGTLIAATGGDLKPFNYFEGKQLTGFEVELTDAIAKKLGLKVEWKVLSFDSLLAGLQRDRWDLAISSHGITEERAKVVDFTNPHYCGGATIVSKDGKVAKAADLAGKTVAVQTGTTYLERLRKMDGIGSVRNFPLDRDARAATVSGRADAWVTDKFVAMEAIKLVPDSGLQQGEILFPEKMAGAASKGNTELVKAFNKGLAEVMADGTYEKLSKKYFDQDIRCKD